MAKINSKGKGNAFERDIVKLFKVLFEDEGFERNAFSGSLYGGSNRHRMQGMNEEHTSAVCGDIICPKDFPFSIECKAYKELDFHNIINGKCTTLDEWIEQAEDDAKASNKEMLVIIKINNKGKYVCTHDLNYGPSTLGGMDTVLNYQGKFCFYSYDIFEEICKRLDLVHVWSINKGKGEL
jgi:hypothetical protein